MNNLKTLKAVLLMTGSLLLMTACMNNNSALDTNQDRNISTDSTGKSNSEHLSAEPNRNQNDELPPENTWYDPLTDPRAKETPGSRAQNSDSAERNHTETKPEQGMNEFTTAVINRTNEERRKLGLNELKVDTTLNQVALKRSQDMQENGYFSHDSPRYGSVYEMIGQQGISFNTAGENIARGEPTPQDVVDTWMNDPGHRANIVNPDFTHIGVGYNASGSYWSQMFIGK